MFAGPPVFTAYGRSVRAANVLAGRHQPIREANLKLLLTSAGIKNKSIHDALVGLLGKPIRRVQRALHPHRGVRPPLGNPSEKA